MERGRALLAGPEHAERHFRAAPADEAGEQWPFERAQTRLDYGEWLRRRRRIAEARPLLTGALDTFRRLGARPWIEHTEAELRAVGIETVGVTPRPITELTPQQQQIVQLAARGLTNREIGPRGGHRVGTAVPADGLDVEAECPRPDFDLRRSAVQDPDLGFLVGMR